MPIPTDTQLDHLKQRLLLRKQQLTGEIAGMADRLRGMPADLPSTHGDQAAEHRLGTTMSAEQARDIAEVSLIEAALERLCNGCYGICIDCDNRIPLRRLRAQPTASRCLRCQMQFERAMRHVTH